MHSADNATNTIVAYGRALTSAISAFDVLEQEAGWFERGQIRLLRATYQQRLRYLVITLPPGLRIKSWGGNRV